MRKFRKWIVLAVLLVLFYYIFVVNFWVTLGVIAALYVAFKLYRLYARAKFRKMGSSKKLLGASELGLFIALTAKVAKADGVVQPLEAQLIGMMFDDISKLFPDKEKTRAILKAIFNEAKERDDDTKAIAQTLNEKIGRSRLKRKQFVEFLIQLAFVDNGISTKEERVLSEIVQALSITPDEYKAMVERFETMLKNKKQSMSLEEACKILGVNENDDMNAIKKVYRKLIREYHPDIIKSQDKDEAYIEEATAKTQEINQAYEVIKAAKK